MTSSPRRRGSSAGPFHLLLLWRGEQPRAASSAGLGSRYRLMSCSARVAARIAPTLPDITCDSRCTPSGPPETCILTPDARLGYDAVLHLSPGPCAVGPGAVHRGRVDEALIAPSPADSLTSGSRFVWRLRTGSSSRARVLVCQSGFQPTAVRTDRFGPPPGNPRGALRERSAGIRSPGAAMPPAPAMQCLCMIAERSFDDWARRQGIGG